MFHGSVAWAMFVLIAARETILDVKDVEGDLIGQRHTIPTLMGGRVSIITAVLLTIMGCIVLTTICVSNSLNYSHAELSLLSACLAVFCWLVMRPTFQLLISKERNPRLLESYTHRTRLAMLITPVFVLIPWIARV